MQLVDLVNCRRNQITQINREYKVIIDSLSQVDGNWLIAWLNIPAPIDPIVLLLVVITY